jgi:hypothetical protein
MPASTVRACGVCHDIANGNVCLSLRDAGQKSVRFTLNPGACRDAGPWLATVAACRGKKTRTRLAPGAGAGCVQLIASCSLAD